MAGSLASRIARSYLTPEDVVLDPFCGSGATLEAAAEIANRVVGVDVNPYAILLASVKLGGFDRDRAAELLKRVTDRAREPQMASRPIAWERKLYWFTPATLRKLETLRHACWNERLSESQEGRAVLLALALSARPCSRADQRSPKPFISREAKRRRKGRHYDPISTMQEVLEELSKYHGVPSETDYYLHQRDIREPGGVGLDPIEASVVVTSPPYINAQDYFRNSMLELYLLEGLLPFSVDDLKPLFIGTERRVPSGLAVGEGAKRRRELIPNLKAIEAASPTHAAVVHAYFEGMRKAFDSILGMISLDGRVVLVCGDNLVCGRHLRTWRVLSAMLRDFGFELIECFGDEIKSRLLAPTRAGHRGLIKEEKVLVFQRHGGLGGRSSG